MSYVEVWRRHRRLWRNFLVWWMGGPPLIGLLGSAVGTLVLEPLVPPRDYKRWLDAVFLLGAATWVAGTTFWAMKLFYGFTCPQCGNLFYLQGLYGNAWTGRCLHCGLRKDASGPIVVPEGASPVELPLFIRQGADLRVFHSTSDANFYLLKANVREAEALDCAGLRLRLKPWGREGLFGGRSERVQLESAEAHPTGQELLREWVMDCLLAHGTSRGWIEQASFDELVHEAALVLKRENDRRTPWWRRSR